jgi:ribosomal protein L11 methyltransferase
VPSWTLREDRLRFKLELIGYFDTEAEGRESYAGLVKHFPELPASPVCVPVVDRDWKEAYKDHFRPWFYGNLHWVPTWLRGSYPLPQGAMAVYLDPGMAFGTGNHETTRLCALRIVDAARDWAASLASRSMLDVGCGSGILAISAAKLGFGRVGGFDIDMEAVQIASENARENALDGQVEFSSGGVEQGLESRQADLVVANILANVLIRYCEPLLKATLPGGHLVLSGILAKEMDDVKAAFAPRAENLWGGFELRSRIDGEWCDVQLSRPAISR